MKEYRKEFFNEEGKLHRLDGPAVEWGNGTKEWYKHGKRHREGGPAVEHTDGYKEFWVDGDLNRKEYWAEGKLHRIDGPARIYGHGTKEWWVNGKRHREDGPAVECFSGIKEWFKNDKLHREDGPAIERPYGSDVIKQWFWKGKRHREDGPAIIYSDGRVEWWVNDIFILSRNLSAGKHNMVNLKMNYNEDIVNSPDHYTSGGIETIEFIKAKLSKDQFHGYLKGNVIKYLSRAGKKDDEIQDLKKAQWYLTKLIEELQDEN